RVGPTIAVTLVLARVVPVPIAAAGGSVGRTFVGLGLGLVASWYLWFHQVVQARARALREFRKWLSAFQRLLEFRDETYRARAMSGVVQTLRECAAWFWDGTGGPPIPPDQGARRETAESAAVEFLNQSGDMLAVQAPL